MKIHAYLAAYVDTNGKVVYIADSTEYDYYYFTTSKMMAERFTSKLACLQAFEKILQRSIKNYSTPLYNYKGFAIVQENVKPRMERDYGDAESCPIDK
jgi:HD superfamily phosphohydrolase YqeK